MKPIRPAFPSHEQHQQPQPLLSICIPTWNRCEQLCAQLEAIAPHLSPLVELVVVENGSTDDTAAFLADFARRHAGAALSFWSNEVNLSADVNYLRALELGRGRWLWLLGDDDDAFDFSRIEALCAALTGVTGAAVLFYHPGWNVPAGSRPARLDAAALMRPELDVLAHAYLHIGMFVLQREAALPYLRHAYRTAIGGLHAYAVISLGLLGDGGEITLLEVSGLFLDPPPRAQIRAPRWNAVAGHWGAWRAFEAGLPEHVPHIRRRESRLRAGAIIKLALVDLAQSGRTVPGLAQWMRQSFRGRYRIAAWSVWLATSIVPRPVARRLGASVLKAVRLSDVNAARNIDY